MESDCIEWDRSRNKEGYGYLYPKNENGKTRGIRVSRMVWEEERGPIPDGLCVLHRCDNPSCINIDHLFLGTRADNSRDAAKKGRMAHGERHYASVLTENDVREIRSGLAGSVIEAAQKYGVSRESIYNVLNRKTWKHL